MLKVEGVRAKISGYVSWLKSNEPVMQILREQPEKRQPLVRNLIIAPTERPARKGVAAMRWILTSNSRNINARKRKTV